MIDVKAVEVISAPNSKCTKGPWYDQDSPRCSLHTTRDRGVHDRRRKIWAPAFSDKSLRGYELRIQGLNDLLISKIDEAKGKTLDRTRGAANPEPQESQLTQRIYSICTRLILWVT